MSVANGKTKGINDRVLKGKLALETHRDRDPQHLLTPDAIRAATQRGMCSWCDRGPFKSIASHTNKAHGIDRRELRHLAGLTMREAVASPEFSEKCRVRAISEDIGNSAAARRGLTLARKASRQYTAAGLAKIAETTRRQMASKSQESRSDGARKASLARTPEGLARIAAAASARVRSQAEREAFAERMREPEVVAKRNASRTLQGCGTVASYKRGCRCEPCRAAKRHARSETKTGGAR